MSDVSLFLSWNMRLLPKSKSNGCWITNAVGTTTAVQQANAPKFCLTFERIKSVLIIKNENKVLVWFQCEMQASCSASITWNYPPDSRPKLHESPTNASCTFSCSRFSFCRILTYRQFTFLYLRENGVIFFI